MTCPSTRGILAGDPAGPKLSPLVPAVVKRYLIDFLALYLGCVGCFLLRTGWNCSAILAAASLDFAITFVPLPARWDRKVIQIAFCTGTFIGMSSVQIIARPLHALEVSLIGATLYTLVDPYCKGLGGRMGFIAFLVTCTWLLLRVLT